VTQSSYKGYFERMDAESFSTDDPVTAGRADILRDNLLHLIDESAQHRINWVRDLGVTNPSLRMNEVGVGNDKASWAQNFPLTWYRPYQPANIDYLIKFAGDSSFDADVTVRIVPHFKPGTLIPYTVGANGMPTLYSTTTTEAVTTGTTTLESQVFFTSTDARVHGPALDVGKLFEYYEDTARALPQLFMVRLELLFDTSASDVEIDIQQVLVREFA